MKEIILKIRFFEREWPKNVKKVNFIFSSETSPFNGRSYQKQKGSETSDQSLFRLWNKLIKIILLNIYYLAKFDDVIQSGFWGISKTKSANLCKPIYDIINYSTSICPFESGKCGKEGKKLQKLEYLENEKSFLDEIKNTFHSFSRTIIWWKNINLIKNSGHKL